MNKEHETTSLSRGNSSPSLDNNNNNAKTKNHLHDNNNNNNNNNKEIQSNMQPEPFPPRPYLRELDFADIVYTPHTLAALILFLSFIVFIVRHYYYYCYPSMDIVDSTKLGLLFSSLSFVFFGSIHLPDSQLVRPHPIVWRMILSVGLLYLMLLCFMLFQKLETVHLIMGLYDPLLRQSLPEVHYAGSCDVFPPLSSLSSLSSLSYLHDSLDIFIVAHLFGYFIKTLILRDWRLATCISLGFEVIEITLQHILPNFKECWWDHLLLDVLLCNGGGTLLGMYVLRRLRAKEYHWVALRNIKSYTGKTQRILGQFSPRSFQFYEWNVFHNPKRFLQFVVVLFFMFLEEVNCFTMKHILRMSPSYHLVVLRLIFWGLIGMPSVRELYSYIHSGDSKMARLGATAWVAISVLLLETCWIVKMSIEGGYFREEMPNYILIPWMCALVLFSVWFVVFFGFLSLEERQNKIGILYKISNVFFYASCMCVVGVVLMGMPDLQIGRSAFQEFIAPHEHYILFWRHE